MIEPGKKKMAKNKPDFHSQLITQARYMRANLTKSEALLLPRLLNCCLGGFNLFGSLSLMDI